MKKAIAIILILAALVCVSACTFGGSDDKEPVATTFVSMDINPSMSFVLDENKKIMSYSLENDDARVLMYGESIVGLKFEEASQNIINLALKMGYLSEDNSVVSVSVISDDIKAEEDILRGIDSAVENANEKVEYDLKANAEGSYLLNYQLKKLKEKNPDNEYYQNLTVGKLRLINSARTADLTLKMDDAVKMSTADLLKIVEKAYAKVEDFQTKSFELAKLAAQEAYQTSVIAAEEWVYFTKYVEYKGLIEGGLAIVEYGTLSVVSKTVDLIAKGLTLAQNLNDKILANDDVLAIATHLGVEVDALRDDEGNVTSKSVGAYIDKVAKIKADELTQDMRDNLDKAIDKLENSKIELEDKPLSQEVVGKIQSLLEMIDIKDINFVKFTLEDLKGVANSLDEKATAVRQKMDFSLSDSQKQSIVEAQKNAVSKLSGAKEKYNQALAQAEKDAKISLQNLKNARLNSLGGQA